MIKGILETFQSILTLDEFSAKGFFQSLDARVKLCGFIAFIITAVSIQTFTPLFMLLAFIIILVLTSNVPFKFFLLRVSMFIPIFSAVVISPLPFTVGETVLAKFWFGSFPITIYVEGAYRALIFILRVWICIAVLNFLILTTKFSTFLYAFRKLKAPSLLVMIMAVTYRFIFLFIEEVYRTLMAREARTGVKVSRLNTIRDLGRIAGGLFIRAYENGEKVYSAMVARGYDGEPRSVSELRFNVQSWLFACIIGAMLGSALIVQYLLSR